MSTPPAWLALTLGALGLFEGTADPRAGAGVAAPIGSVYLEHGAVHRVDYKTDAADTAWTPQNLTGMRVFNVKTYGAVGDGVADDTTAINAAIAACNTAGGGIIYFPPGTYRATKNAIPSGLAEFVSFFMDNVQNVTFLGDGNASKIVFSDNTAGTFWDGFYARNGASNISWRDLSMDGTAMVTTPAGNSLIQITSQAPDANLGMHDFTVQGCTIGPTTGTGLFVDNTDVAHAITNIRCLDSTLDGTASVGVGTGANALALINYLDNLTVARNYCLGGAAQGNSAVVRVAANGTNVTAWDWKITSNHGVRLDDPGVAVGVISSDGGLQAHNSVTSLVASLSTGPSWQPYRLVYGNVVVQTGSNNQPELSAGQFSADGLSITVRANVVIRQVYTAGATSCLNVINNSHVRTLFNVSDNIVDSGSTANVNFINLASTLGGQYVVSGNIAVSHDVLAATGAGININGGGTDGPVASSIVGNLVMSVAGNPPIQGLTCTSNAGFNTRLTNVFMNLFAGTGRGVNVSQGTKSQQIRVAGNNHTGVTTSDVLPPVTNTGYTASGNASSGAAQGLVSAATMAGNAPAVKGSFGLDTAGGQYVTLQYKETDDGTVGGGTAGWLGVGGGDFVFGAKNGSTNTAARFFAMGMGLVTETATEIQYPVHRSCTVRNLRLRCSAGTGSGTCTFVVRKNGVNTAVTTGAINNTATTGTDTTNSVAFAAADLISFQVTRAGTITTAQTNIRAVLEAA